MIDWVLMPGCSLSGLDSGTVGESVWRVDACGLGLDTRIAQSRHGNFCMTGSDQHIEWSSCYTRYRDNTSIFKTEASRLQHHLPQHCQAPSVLEPDRSHIGVLSPCYILNSSGLGSGCRV